MLKRGLPWTIGPLRGIVLFMMVGAAVIGTLVVTAAIASITRSTKPPAVFRAPSPVARTLHSGRTPNPTGGKTGFSILTRPPRKGARVATADELNPPQAAILAAVNGSNHLYVWPRTHEEICVMNLHAEGPGGAACSQISVAEEEGVVLIHMPNADSTLSVAVLVPNGVDSIKATDGDGASHAVSVANNVVDVEDPNLAFVHYTLPDGASQTVNVAEALVGRPTSPGAIPAGP